MNLREAVLNALRNGNHPADIAAHHSISERDILMIVSNEMSAKLPEHLVEYLKLQDMEALWAEHSCRKTMPPPEAWTMLHAQRDRFRLAMELEVRRVAGINGHPEIKGPVDAFRGVLEEKERASLRQKQIALQEQMEKEELGSKRSKKAKKGGR